MFVLVFIAFTCLYLVLGADGAFKPGSYDASNLWMALSIVIGIVIAILAGFICATIAKGGRAHVGLAIVVLVLGLLFVIPTIMVHNAKPNLPRTGYVSNMDAMQRARQPIWAPFAFPFISAAAVLIGGKLKRRA
jgi:hypothetical protein